MEPRLPRPPAASILLASSGCFQTVMTSFLFNSPSSSTIQWDLLFSHVWLFATPWAVARPAPLSMGFPGKNTGVGCHALLQGDLSDQGIESISCNGRQIVYCWATREALHLDYPPFINPEREHSGRSRRFWHGRCWWQVLLGHPGGSCVATRGLCKQATWWDSPGISLGDPFILPTFILMVVDKEKTMVYQK